MSLYESFSNVEEPRQLTEQEIEQFTEFVIIPLAEQQWGDRFRAPDLVDYCDDYKIYFPALDRENGVEITLSTVHDATMELDSQQRPIEGTVEHDLSVAVGFAGFRRDVTQKYRSDFSSDLTVWEVIDYEFPINGGTPVVYRRFDLRTSDGYDMDPRKKHRNYIRNMGESGDFALPQRRAITLQDRLDVTNLVLALDMAEETLSRPNED